MSVMAHGSEDPAPSHRVHGWNQVVHLDWSSGNIFVRQIHPSHTCSHGPCFTVGDFGFALIVPNRPKAKAALRLGHLRFSWHNTLNPRLPVSRCQDLWCNLFLLIVNLGRKRASIRRYRSDSEQTPPSSATFPTRQMSSSWPKYGEIILAVKRSGGLVSCGTCRTISH